MKKRKADREKMMASARSFYWVGFRVSADLTKSAVQQAPTHVGPLGNLLSSTVLVALSAETSIKALQMLQLGSFEEGHDLLKLFNRLSSGMKEGINIMDQALAQDLNKIGNQPIIPEGSVRDVLRDHRYDFEKWRYFYELSDGTNVNLQDLRFASLALILTYDIVTVRPADHDLPTYLANPMQWIMDNRLQWMIGIRE